MPEHVCPWWIGYLLASPLRRLLYDPREMLAPYVRKGMTVLEPGPGMGYFTIELARLVGSSGRVVALELQSQMLRGLQRRAAKAGLLQRIDARQTASDSLGIADLAGKADFALAFAVVHEMPLAERFFAELAGAMKADALLLFAEPSSHVTPAKFKEELESAARAGFRSLEALPLRRSRAVLLKKDS